MYLGVFPGGWRIFPALYTVALVAVAVLTLVIVPRHDRMGGAGKPMREMLAPLRHVRVWRFSLYYAAVFGAYVALAAWLPKYYVDNFDLELQKAALLTPPSSSPHRCSARSAAGSPTATAPGGSCTGPSE